MSTNTTTTETLILHAAGIDRLGIVSDVTGLVIDAGGNVGESTAGRLGANYFSLMMLVEIPCHSKESLQQQIRQLPDLESAVFTVNPVEKPERTVEIGCRYNMPPHTISSHIILLNRFW